LKIVQTFYKRNKRAFDKVKLFDVLNGLFSSNKSSLEAPNVNLSNSSLQKFFNSLVDIEAMEVYKNFKNILSKVYKNK
jgi:hypothetical protein